MDINGENVMLREKISSYVKGLSNIDGNEDDIANNILDIIENEGLELDEWREDTSIDRYTQEMVLKYSDRNSNPDCLAIAVLFMLNDEGLSLIGNGWLDDDDLSTRIIDEIYHVMIVTRDGKIASSEYQDVFDIAIL